VTHTYKEGQVLKCRERRVKVLKCLDLDFILDDEPYYKIEFVDSKMTMILKEQDLDALSIEEIVLDQELLKSVCDCGAWVTSKPADHFVWCSIYPATGKRS
jgi:hypothetical protein